MAEIPALTGTRKRKSRFNNVHCTLDGHTFKSRAEQKYYCELVIREKAAEIAGLRVHPKFPISINGIVVYTVELDFMYTDMALRRIVAVDVKGVWKNQKSQKGKGSYTALSALTHKMFEAAYGIRVEIVGVSS